MCCDFNVHLAKLLEASSLYLQSHNFKYFNILCLELKRVKDSLLSIYLHVMWPLTDISESWTSKRDVIEILTSNLREYFK